ncbi:MAG: aspartate/glutamate racemase family protein [Castellaniella sp.]|uniref:aspartate/glutamate racemase family protein n=1 Tax=Castellaniella sp. TaxID=1955812 RepID=UPI003C7452E6
MPRYIVRRQAESYGHDIGILLLDCRTPFIPGDVGNARTYGFPVLYRTMPGVTLDRLINQADRSMEQVIVENARALEQSGVCAITSDCGYMMHFQEVVAASVQIPVMLSSLLQLPFVSAMLGPDQAVGLICANRQRLTEDLLAPLRASMRCNLHITGLEHAPNFRGPILDETDVLDSDAIEGEVVAAALDLKREHPEIEAWLLECSNLPPYAHAVQAATGKPVFDFVTMINSVQAAARRQPFNGYY